MTTEMDKDPTLTHETVAGKPAGSRSSRGFASMDQARQREIASAGGRSQGKDNNPGNFANDRQKASVAGRQGGRSQGRANNPGNFANDRAKASAAGRKGGEARGANAHAAARAASTLKSGSNSAQHR